MLNFSPKADLLHLIPWNDRSHTHCKSCQSHAGKLLSLKKAHQILCSNLGPSANARAYMQMQNMLYVESEIQRETSDL